MKGLFYLPLLLFFSSLFADSTVNYLPSVPVPPNPINPYVNGKNIYDPSRSMTSRVFSDANATAIHFLNVVDNHLFGGAWLETGSLMQDVVARDVWALGMGALRAPLGVVKARKVGAHQALTTLPKGTQGEFMIIQYETEFAKKPAAIETVVLMMERPIGIWKVISYSIGR